MSDSNITKNALAAAMKKRMAQEPFSKISVGEICEGCGMNRKSFYYHFRDKYDLINWIFETEFIETIHTKDYTNGWGLLEDICRYFYREKAFYRNALQVHGQNGFREYFEETIEPFLVAFAGDLLEKEGESDKEFRFYATFFSDAFLAAVIRWLSTGTDGMTPDVFLSRCRKAMQHLFHLLPEEPGQVHGEPTATGAES